MSKIVYKCCEEIFFDAQFLLVQNEFNKIFKIMMGIPKSHIMHGMHMDKFIDFSVFSNLLSHDKATLLDPEKYYNNEDYNIPTDYWWFTFRFNKKEEEKIKQFETDTIKLKFILNYINNNRIFENFYKTVKICNYTQNIMFYGNKTIYNNNGIIYDTDICCSNNDYKNLFPIKIKYNIHKKNIEVRNYKNEIISLSLDDFIKEMNITIEEIANKKKLNKRYKNCYTKLDSLEFTITMNETVYIIEHANILYKGTIKDLLKRKLKIPMSHIQEVFIKNI